MNERHPSASPESADAFQQEDVSALVAALEGLISNLEEHDDRNREPECPLCNAVEDARTALASYRSQAAPGVQQTAPVGSELPPLPTPWRTIEDADGVQVPVFRAFQMRDFARAALASASPAVGEPLFLYREGEHQAFRANVVASWPAHNREGMTNPLYTHPAPTEPPARREEQMLRCLRLLPASPEDQRVYDGIAANYAGVQQPVAFTDEHLSYVDRYGGLCRDCADENGVCPTRGLPCGGSKKAIEFVFRALEYGISHGYISSPFAPPTERGTAEKGSNDGRS